MGAETNILLVENNPGDAKLFREVIREISEVRFTVQNVTCLQELITLSGESSSDADFDIIVLDLDLPDSAGLSTLLSCKNAFHEVPIIVFSGHDDESIAVEAVKFGAQDYLVKGFVDGRAMVRTIHHAIERHALWQQLEQAEQREHFLATRDPLTGLLNRYSLSEILKNQIKHSARRQELMATIILDIDRFKSVNDSLGYLVGDALLIDVGRRLQNCVRITDTVAHLGGDEFVLILTNLQAQDDAARVCEKVLSELAKPFFYQAHELYIGCSIGIALYPDDAADYESMIKHAGAAMHSAKDAGRQCYKFYCQKMADTARQRLTIENDMRRAIETGAFKLVYQPIYNVATQTLEGVEALIRWPREDGTVLNPYAFIDIAEETGLIVPLGEYVLREACEQAIRWSDSGLPPISMSVNVSARQFEEENFVGTVSTILKETGLNSKRLILELTEHVVMADAEVAAVTLNELKAMGIRLAIDDFGTGYSSLSYLNRFPIDTLKIDQTFVQKLEHGEKDLALVEAIVALAQRLGLEITAEGVETEHQCKIMKNLGCDRLQGFHLNCPMDADQIPDACAA